MPSSSHVLDDTASTAKLASHDISLAQLTAFLQVAELGSVSLAASSLGVSQPTLSRQLTTLEHRLGQTLLDRHARPLKLTAAGQFFVEHAKKSLYELSEVISQTKRFDAKMDETLVIGFVASILYGKLPSVISQLRVLMPSVKVRLVEVSAHEQTKALKLGEIHAGFGRFASDDVLVNQVFLCHEPYVAAIPKGHKLASHAGVSLSELSKNTLILYHRTLVTLGDGMTLDPIASLFLQRRLQPTTHKVRDIQIALGLVSAGEGVTLVPQSLSTVRGDEIAYVPILRQTPTSTVYLTVPAHQEDARLTALIQASRQVYTQADA